MCFWFIPKTASTASSSTGALVAAGSLQPSRGENGPTGALVGAGSLQL